MKVKAAPKHDRKQTFLPIFIVSFLLAGLAPDSGKAHCINAGQPRPLLYRNGEIFEIEPAGPHFPLGVVEDAAYTPAAIEFARGDIMLLATDGLTEAMNSEREMFGDERLREAFSDIAAENPGAAGWWNRSCSESRPSLQAQSGTTT